MSFRFRGLAVLAAAAGSVLILLRRAAFLAAATPTRSELRGELAVHENKFAATYCAFQASDRISSPISSISNGIRVVSAQSVCVESTLFLFFYSVVVKKREGKF